MRPFRAVKLKLPAASAGLIAVAALLSAFLFPVVVSLWSRAGMWLTGTGAQRRTHQANQ
jgi:hypothetical protein